MFFFFLKQFCFYVKLVLISIFRAPIDKTTPLSFRRIVILLALNTGAIFVLGTNWLCLLLDNLFFPDYRNVEIKKPYFILGVPRSGSTMLLRLMAQDEKNFATFKMWEIIFAPSIIQRKFYGFLGKIDTMMGEIVTRTLKRIDKWLFKSSKTIHQVGLFLHEEDGILLVWIFSTFFVFFAYPYMDQFKPFLNFDEEISESDKKYIMRYYTGCLKRHLYYHGAHKTLLSKNPTFAPKVRTLQEYFPDAIFINTVRTPYEQIPSIYSFLVYFISQFGGDFLKVPNYKNIVLEVIKKFYLNPVTSLKKMNESQYKFAIFTDLIKDLDKEIRGIYTKFGLEMTPDFEKILSAKVASSKGYKSGHQYSLEQFNLTADEILHHYLPIFDEFGFDKVF